MPQWISRLGYDLADSSILADTALVYKNVGNGIDSIDEASASIISTMQAFKIEAEDSMAVVDKFNEVGNKFAITAKGVMATNTATVATKGLWATITALLKSNPIGWGIMAIMAVWELGSKAYEHFTQKNDRLIEQAKELKEAFEMEMGEITTDLGSLRALEEEFATLSQGVDDYGNNISLATDDYTRYKDMVQTIVDISPSLISGYDAEGNAIANKNDLLEQSIALMEEEQRLKRAEYTTTENLTDIIRGAAGTADEVKPVNPATPSYQLSEGLSVLAYEKFDGQVANYAEGILGYNDLLDQVIEELIRESPGNTWFKVISNDLLSVDSKLKEFLEGEDLLPLQNIAAQYQSEIQSYNAQMEKISQEVTPYLQWLSMDVPEYHSLLDSQKEFLSTYINNFRISGDMTKISEREVEEIRAGIISFTEGLISDDMLKNTIELGVTLRTRVDTDGNTLSVAEYEAQFAEMIAHLEGIEDEEVRAVIEAQFGIEVDEDGARDEVTEAIAGVRARLTEDCQDLLPDMTVEQVLEIVASISLVNGKVDFNTNFSQLFCVFFCT